MKVRVKPYSEIRKTLNLDTIDFANEMREFCGKVIDVKKRGTRDDDYFGEDWWWDKKWLEFDIKSPIEAIIFKDRTTTIISADGHKYTATCADGDEWDYEKGAMAAAMRMPCKINYNDIAPYLQH